MGTKQKRVSIVSITFDDGTSKRIEFDETNPCTYKEIHNVRANGNGSFLYGTPFVTHEIYWNTKDRLEDQNKVQQLDAQDLEKIKQP